MIIKKTVEIGGKLVTLEVGRMARLAHGSAVMTIGESIVLCTACSSDPRPGIDFFPLTIDYREKTYAAGKIPGGFFKREGRPTTKEVLSCRLIDRPLRPLFAEGYNDEVQVLCNVLSFDAIHNTDVMAGTTGSMALMLSPIPLLGPVAWVRVGHLDGQLVLYPDDNRMKESKLDLVVAGTKEAVTMVEAGMDELDESTVLDAIDMAHGAIKQLCDLQTEVLQAAGVTPARETYVGPEDSNAPLRDLVRDRYKAEVRDKIVAPSKPERQQNLKPIVEKAVEALGDLEETGAEGKWPVKAVKRALRDIGDEVLRELILEGTRVDGRGPTDIRDISCEVGILPRAHGSALFTRGETQAIVGATLGTGRDEEIIDGLAEEYKKNFYLHYNFPPFSVGEVRPMRGTSRREIGHGNLAERALAKVVPDAESFP
ncbi:MAG: polyribonucleotide nucleotidyltransferase, partial [Planctomycetota bacterium]|nr:polyribonucleotide nucleotidyltransferase [Planctomycetota bacterium]